MTISGKSLTASMILRGSVGRRYSRADEEGVFLCCTVDFESLEDESVTVRHRDTAKQIRVKISDLRKVITELLNGAGFESFGELSS